MASQIGPRYSSLTAMAQWGSGGGSFGGGGGGGYGGVSHGGNPAGTNFASYGNMSVVDKAGPEMHHLIDAYWHQFPPLNPLWYGILGVAICILGTISICGNCMVMYIFSTTKSLRTPSNLLIINLAFSDFGMMFTMAAPMAVNCYYETWVFGPLACEIYGTLGSLWGCASILTNCMIAFDRYNVIVKGLSAKPMNTAGALLRVLLIWVMSAFWTVVPLVGWGRYTPEGNLTTCGTDYLTRDANNISYVVAYTVFVYMIPLALIIYSYWYILKAVSAHEKNMREQAKKMNVASLRQGQSDQRTENKLAKVALTTVSLWFVAWTPYTIINFAGIFDWGTMTPLCTIWGVVCAKSSAVYNPIVYGISHPRYQAALFARFPSLSCAGEAPAPAVDAVSTASGVMSVVDQDKSNS